MVSVPQQSKVLFSRYNLSSLIDHAYHALAIDEKRKTFAPTLWEKSKNANNRTTPQVLEQRWFSGVHSNVGGGYPDEGLSDIPLNWLLQKAGNTGLAYNALLALNDVKPNYKGTIYNSSTGLFSFAKPYVRPIDKTVTMIDESVFERIKDLKEYKPANV